MYETLLQLGMDATTAKDTADTLAKIMEERINPNEFWECAGTGSYKECYIIDNVAIKFAIEDNETMAREGAVYNCAIEQGVDRIFAKTVFAPLEQTLPSYFLDDEDGDGARLDCMVLQERVRVLGEKEGYKCLYNQRMYENYPLYENGEKIPYEDIGRFLYFFCYQEWAQAAINTYGLEFMKKCADFCYEAGVDDLHAYNLGFRADGSPVIFDFTS